MTTRTNMNIYWNPLSQNFSFFFKVLFSCLSLDKNNTYWKKKYSSSILVLFNTNYISHSLTLTHYVLFMLSWSGNLQVCQHQYQPSASKSLVCESEGPGLAAGTSQSWHLLGFCPWYSLEGHETATVPQTMIYLARRRRRTMWMTVESATHSDSY